MSDGAKAEALVPKFKLERMLNLDQGGKRVTLLGTIDNGPALLIFERAPFSDNPEYLASIPFSLSCLKNLGSNDVYSWFLANSGNGAGKSERSIADLKINLIHPCTETHVRKYSKQVFRFLVETPEIYEKYVRPFMAAQRMGGRLDWVYNIIDGKAEADTVIYRTPPGCDSKAGFVLTPDLNWDGRTLSALHLLCLVERRDIWSLRDLNKSHIPWLQHMRSQLTQSACNKYPEIAEDQLKLYVHYQPTYYHFHIHIVHVQLEAGPTQTIGKAIGLDSIIETLSAMSGNDETAGMDKISISYVLGEAHELWTRIFEPLKRGEVPNL